MRRSCSLNTIRSSPRECMPRCIVVGILHPGYVQTAMGGPTADITPEESAAGIRKVTADWTIERTGDFLRWNGETHPW